MRPSSDEHPSIVEVDVFTFTTQSARQRATLSSESIAIALHSLTMRFRAIAFLLVLGASIGWLAATIGWGWTMVVVWFGFCFWVAIRLSVKEDRQKRAVGRAAYAPYVPGAPKFQRQEYKNERELEQDARRRMAVGWIPQGYSETSGGAGMLSAGISAALASAHPVAAALTPFVGPKRKGKIVVAWVRSSD